MKKAQVSVIMSVYNGGLTLERAIKSIIEQSFQYWELVIVDDGSSDHTPILLERMAKADGRIKLHRNSSNLGIGASLNIAWKKSAFDLIARMDADDFSLPNRLERQVQFMTRNPDISILGTAVELTDGVGNRLGFEYRPEIHDDIVARLYKEIPVFHPTVMMRKEFLIKVGGYNERLRRSEDLDLWLRSYNSFRFHNLPKAYLRYSVPVKVRWSELSERTSVLIKAACRENQPFVRWWYIGRFIAAGVLALALRRSVARRRFHTSRTSVSVADQ